MTYAEKLKDPRWQKKRLKIMEYANWRCQICGGKDRTLHCHHSYYTRGKQPWQYPDGSIICICETCHEKIHAPAIQHEVHAELKLQPVCEESAKEKFRRLRELLEKTPG